MGFNEWGGGVISGVADIASGLVGANATRKAASRNHQVQEDFAKSGIRWRVADAEAAGLHPLAALGASVTPGVPIAVGDTSMANAVSNFGQDISRAVSATRSAHERRLASIALQTAEAGLDGQVIENAIKQHQLKEMQKVGPPMPVEPQPFRPIMTEAGQPGKEAGSMADYNFVADNLGGLSPVPSSDVKQRIEDNMFQEAAWEIRNRLSGMLQPWANRPNVNPGPGKRWSFNPVLGRWSRIRKLPGLIQKSMDSYESFRRRKYEGR